MAQTAKDINMMLADDMARFYADPIGFVMYAYEWGKGDLSGFDGPFEWQMDFLRWWGREILVRGFTGRASVDAILGAVTSGHGIGKSALTAWAVDFIMSTRPHAQGTITANTNAQLETKTWAQIALWTKRCITGHWFTINTGRGSMRMYHKAYPESWFCSAQTCKEENSEAFAGQHAVNSTSFYIFDESSAVPDKIDEVAQGGLTDGEPMFFKFGNPTRNTGHFHNCFHRLRHRWKTWKIDSRSVPITNKNQIQNWIDDFGDDSDFVRVRVKGEFPRSSALQFIPSDIVEEARGKTIHPISYVDAPKILGVDIARSGDDQTVIVKRQGRASFGFRKFRGLTTFPIAKSIAQTIDDWEPDQVFIDMGNIGAAIFDVLIQWGYGRVVTGIWFGGGSDLQQCKNKRAEMWWRMRDWLASGSIPDDSELCDDLVGPEVIPDDAGVVRLEPKEVMKKRGLASPDCGDALALTFAAPVMPKSPTLEQRHNRPAQHSAKTDYDVLSHGMKQQGAITDYDVLGVR